MNAFVIAKKNVEFLDSPVFHAGETGGEEAIAVFTTRERAAQYIDDAGWNEEYEVGELRPIQLVRWLATTHEDGTEMVTINPLRKAQLDGAEQRVVYLNEPFAAFAELLSGEIIKKADSQEVKKDTRRSDDYRQLVETLNKLGIACQDVALDKLDSASAAVCCFPMYMVANAGTLVDDPQSKDKQRDLLGIGKLRESFVIGKRESNMQQAFEFRADHLETLHALLTPGPLDQVAYDDALEAIRLFFSCAEPRVVAVAKQAIARMIASVAHAAGEGLFGSGHEATAAQQQCIRKLRDALALDREPSATAELAEIND
jgi:hypothetical protein